MTLSAHAWPALFALLVWWLSTGAVIFLDGLPQRTFKWSMLGASVVLLLALFGLNAVGGDLSIPGAYLSFSCGLAVWAWIELSFYTGYVTGPRKVRCAEGCSGWRHFVHALQASLWHELAIVAAFLAVLALSWKQPNQVGLFTFLVLWWMHESARLNVFLGVRNLNKDFLPAHLSYLESFLRQKPINLLFPVSVTVSTLVCAWLAMQAAAPGATAFDAACLTFLTVLMALAILEHWFLVLPLPSEALWNWALAARPDPQDQDRSKPARQHGLSTWSTRLPGSCDPVALKRLLDSMALGGFGNIERVRGITRAGCGWVEFDLAGGHSNISAFSPADCDEARVVAVGRELDEVGLQNAFETCAAPAIEAGR